MRGVVEDWADEIVHGGVDDDEGFFRIELGVDDDGEQDACRGDDGAAGFEEQTHAQRANDSGNHARVCGARDWFFVGVADAEAAAEIEIAEDDALAAQIEQITPYTF